MKLSYIKWVIISLFKTFFQVNFYKGLLNKNSEFVDTLNPIFNAY